MSLLRIVSGKMPALPVAIGLLVGACVGDANEQAAGSHRCDEATDTPQVSTTRYDLAVGVTDRKPLLDPQAAGATGGEIVVAGRARDGPVHLDIRICKRGSIRPARVRPRVMVIDRTTGARRSADVARLTGTGEGRAGVHYGNNLPLPHHARLQVDVGGERVLLVPPTG